MSRNEILGILRQYKNKNADKYGLLALGVFGSVARDQAQSGSDLDIVIKMTKPDLFAMVHIKEDLEEQCHVKVDIVNYRERMNQYLKRHIDQEAIYA
jgi:uncharacterized protein